jgi:hypothetical protein
MSPINLDTLASNYPRYSRAWRKLQSWMDAHADAQYIYPKRLAREVPDVDPIALAEVLTLLTREGILRRVYKVLTPNGVLADGEFEDPTQIPDKLADRFENYFDTSDADVVPIFKSVA